MLIGWGGSGEQDLGGDKGRRPLKGYWPLRDIIRGYRESGPYWHYKVPKSLLKAFQRPLNGFYKVCQRSYKDCERSLKGP